MGGGRSVPPVCPRTVQYITFSVIIIEVYAILGSSALCVVVVNLTGCNEIGPNVVQSLKVLYSISGALI